MGTPDTTFHSNPTSLMDTKPKKHREDKLETTETGYTWGAGAKMGKERKWGRENRGEAA